MVVASLSLSSPSFSSLPTTHTDPYLNIDAGTMSPFEHGEVFVLDDGGEVNREKRECVSW